jgi:16S rRNA (cytidine1402-2'-O)-methyltransferase
MEKGKLYIVSLPLGNLEDVTLRALRILSEVDVILAEDTREVAKFLRLKNLPKKTLISYRDQNHLRVTPALLERLAVGQAIALVSDRGTPTISDPGYRLVHDVVVITALRSLLYLVL